MKTKSRFVWSQLIKYFGQGLLFVVPIFATFAVLYYLFDKLDTLLNLDIPGLGLVIIFVGVTLIGFVGTRLVTTPAFKGINKLINRAPIIKIIYSSVKDLLEAFVGSKKKFTEPVIVKINNDSDVSQIGFLTQTDLTDLGIKEGFVSVYVPFSYSIMGNVYVVPRINVKKLDSSPTETMKFVVSGGITNVSEQRKEKEIK
jgi:uncharacterized membrane protein